MRQKVPEEKRQIFNKILHFHFLKTLLLHLAQTHTTSETKSQLRRAQQIEGVETAANTRWDSCTETDFTTPQFHFGRRHSDSSHLSPDWLGPCLQKRTCFSCCPVTLKVCSGERSWWRDWCQHSSSTTAGRRACAQDLLHKAFKSHSSVTPCLHQHLKLNAIMKVSFILFCPKAKLLKGKMMTSLSFSLVAATCTHAQLPI